VEEERYYHCHLDKLKRLFGASPSIGRAKAILIASHTRSCGMGPSRFKTQIAASECGCSSFSGLLCSAAPLDPQARKS